MRAHLPGARSLWRHCSRRAPDQLHTLRLRCAFTGDGLGFQGGALALSWPDRRALCMKIFLCTSEVWYALDMLVSPHSAWRLQGKYGCRLSEMAMLTHLVRQCAHGKIWQCSQGC